MILYPLINFENYKSLFQKHQFCRRQKYLSRTYQKSLFRSRAILQNNFGNHPQIATLLKFYPAGTTNEKTITIKVGGQNYIIPLGDVTSSSSQRWLKSIR